jgi:aspartate/methionine/tyrosine aminotransferase
MFEHALANRMAGLAGESAFQVLAAANRLEAQGKRIIHFEIGEPDFPTARHIVDAAKRALDAGQTTYCNAQGLVSLREAVAGYTLAYKGIETKKEEIVIAPGGKPIIFNTICALVNPGDEVIYPDPGFPTYESVIRYAGGIPIPVVLEEKSQFRLRTEELKAKISSRTKLLILNSPSNPTGGFLTGGDLEEIAATVRAKDIFVLSDEIYSRIVYGGSARSIATCPGMKEKTIILDGFSKTYCMTGWRLGYGIMHEELADQVTRLLINSNSCTTHFVQTAGIAALTGPQESVDAMVREFAHRRDVIVDGLASLPGVTCRKPDGAFYAFPHITGTGLSSREIADFLLNEAGVAVLDGTAFGRAGDGYLRLSYATSLDGINAGLERIADALKKLAGK